MLDFMKKGTDLFFIRIILLLFSPILQQHDHSQLVDNKRGHG
jgi:hypothetical protein